jgi:hypothetical protein
MRIFALALTGSPAADSGVMWGNAFLRTRPPVEGDPSFMTYRAEWLATFLLSEAPEGPIREHAIEKAGRRSEELRIKKPALEIMEREGGTTPEHLAQPAEKTRLSTGSTAPHETTRTRCSKRPAQPLIPQHQMAGSHFSA